MLRRSIGRYSVTVDTVQEAVPDAEPRRRELSPLLTIRAIQVVLWLLVISGPVAALLVANHVSSLDDRLNTLGAATGIEVSPGLKVRVPLAVR